jgi:ribonuclease BN (tRNA processing enzyme)
VKVRVLGCSGSIATHCRTTSFLIDHDVLLEAGTGVGDLTLPEMCRVNHVVLSHSHLDHIAALPLMVDAVASQRTTPITVYALAGTIAALQTHIFNNVIWPDFSRIPTIETPFIRFQEISIGQTFHINDRHIEVLPAIHTVAAAGFSISSHNKCWVYTGDTERNPAFWKRLNQLNVAILVIETAFSNREKELARKSLHLAPSVLAHELTFIENHQNFPIYITHTKPAETELIMEEIHQFDHPELMGMNGVKHDIRQMRIGQEFYL